MDVKAWVSETAPEPVARVLRSAYYAVFPATSPEQIRVDWKATIPDYDRYAGELTAHPAYDGIVETLEALSNGGAIGRDAMQDLYVLVRTQRPDVVVETGVCNGASTFAMLAALEENGRGELHSIDYPFHSSVPMARRREETFPGIGQAEIPADREPGWLVPADLRDRWTFYEGKSQEVLPGVLRDHPPDLFVHDSEHSHPAMMFELEAAWHAMDAGAIVCDDITWNDAFDVFTEVRADSFDRMSENRGYVEVT